ncbi:UNVERIFIED_CONTAM: hypothetical protein K2H54_061156 [Gekko kuhli]
MRLKQLYNLPLRLQRERVPLLSLDIEIKQHVFLKAKSKSASFTILGDATSPFDPVTIASQLQHIGDHYNRDLNQHIDMLAAEMLEGKVEKFGEMVESLSKEWSSHSPGLEYERAFLAVSVRLFKDLVKKIPPVVSSALLAGLINGNTGVRGYIEEHGGWVS